MRSYAVFTALLIALLVLSPLSQAYGSKDEGGANIEVIPSRSAINITFNGTDFFEMEFSSIYAGSLNFLHMPNFWYGDLSGMNYTKEYGKNDKMGEYLHIRMWKNLTLSPVMQWGRSYHAKIFLDFYVASRNYTKGKVVVDRYTLRYDVKIVTDCPADFVYLDHRIRTSNLDRSEVLAQMDDEFQEIEKRHGKFWLNASQWGGVKIMNDENSCVRYSWDAEYLAGVQYEYWDGYMDIFFIYRNTGNIVQDPYVKLPFPLFSNETAEKIVSYFFEHAVSISIGIAVAGAVIFVPAVLRRRRL